MNAGYSVGDKVRLFGAEVWTVERVFLSMFDFGFRYGIRRGCCHKVVSDDSIRIYRGQE